MELSPETGLVANEVEGIFLVLRRAKTPRESVQSTIEKFRKEQFQGIILNGYDKPAKYYKYAKKGYYNYGYSYHSEHTETAHDLRT
jgi:Mrp family chromosome partitioning ATPase